MSPAMLLAAALGIASSAAGCGRENASGPDSGPITDASAEIDAPESVPLQVAHIPPASAYAGKAAVEWLDGLLVDTSELHMGGTAYPGGPGDDLVFDAWAQTASEVGQHPEVAVLRVGALYVPAGTTARVTGDRPLVIIAAGEVRIDGVIDVSARGPVPGAGGAAPRQGPGAGTDGLHSSPRREHDSGGGGAGHATEGAHGGMGCSGSCYSGTSDLPGGEPGPAYGNASLTVLRGGSGGGAGGAGSEERCAPGHGGAGGGAVQITSATAIHIGPAGGIHAGGGGGGGGSTGEDCTATAGGGGGAGGAIYLQAPIIRNQGILAANGGSGGGGAGTDAPGGAGQDGQLGPLRADAGQGTDQGAQGGRGAALEGPPMPGPNYTVNGGGGGGAAGRIVLHAPDIESTGILSPEAAELPAS